MDKKSTDGLELAFASVSPLFLEEDLEIIEDELNFPEFVRNGKYVKNEGEVKFKHEWWARPEDIKALNKQMAEKYPTEVQCEKEKTACGKES